MKVDFVNPFISAAREVLAAELAADTERGPLQLRQGSDTSDDVTAMIAVTGTVTGLVLYSMTSTTAQAMAGTMIGQTCESLDELAQSAIAELANMITGRAGVLLEEASYPSDISPPALIIGHGTTISTIDLQRLVVPITTTCGDVSIHVALEKAA